ncbi:hypothetical protein [Coleofasciculus sp.]|uniref:hypothetical protein n=1 Tax=Coleofasciculus sp. TaxID=3100458 RepID=UPI0039F7BC03
MTDNEDWAGTQNNLANAYRDRIRGERAENLEQAIAAYNLALQVSTREAFPQNWAETQSNLAEALMQRATLTENIKNLDTAITLLQEALEIAVPRSPNFIDSQYAEVDNLYQAAQRAMERQAREVYV